MIQGVSVPLPDLVYAWPEKEQFDLIAIEEVLHEWKEDRVTTLVKHDGRRWERRCHSKSLERDGVRVIFQWFDERPICVTA